MLIAYLETFIKSGLVIMAHLLDVINLIEFGVEQIAKPHFGDWDGFKNQTRNKTLIFQRYRDQKSLSIATLKGTKK